MAETVVVRELLALLGIKADAGSMDLLDDFQTALDELSGLLEVSVAGFAAAGVGLTALIATSAMAGNEAAKNADAVALQVEEYQRLSYALGLAGLKEEQRLNALRMQNQKVQSAIAAEQDYLEALDGTRVKITDVNGALLGQSEIMDRVADVMATTEDKQKRLTIATSFYGEEVGARMVTALKGGSDALAAMKDEATALGLVIGEEQARESEQFLDNMARLLDIAGALRNELAEDLLPVLNDFIEGIQAWYLANRDLIVQEVELWARGLAAAFEELVEIGAEAYELAEQLGGLETILTGLTLAALGLAGALGVAGVVGAIATLGSLLLSLNPVVLLFEAAIIVVGASLAGIAATLVMIPLAMEDFRAFLMGTNSALGEFIANNREADSTLGQMVRLFEQFVATGKQLGDIIGDVFLPLIDQFGPQVAALFEAMGVSIEDGAIKPLTMLEALLVGITNALREIQELLATVEVGLDAARNFGDILGIGGGGGLGGQARSMVGGLASDSGALGGPQASTTVDASSSVSLGGFTAHITAGMNPEDVASQAAEKVRSFVLQSMAAADGGVV